MSRDYAISGKTIFITGAARGIGAAAARRLHQRGARVALVGLEPELLRELADELGTGAAWFEADVTDAEAMARAVAGTVDKFGGIDVVIANAGVLHIGSVAESLPHQFERTLDVNLMGVWRTLRATLPQVIARQGYILNVASVAALGHGPLMGAYAASKAAVDALSDSLRIELGPSGARVGCAYFGAIDTDLVQGSRVHPAMAALETLAPRFLGAEIPLSEAADVIEDGIRRRAARIWAPRWVGLFLLLRGIAQPVMEWRVRGSPGLASALDLARPDSNGTENQDDRLGTAANVRARRRKA
ncbi:SDR family NAD(P)-dependent oxidoreductase [Solimonas sp. K1W22B-7]|uniref:short-chain dehydrogenase/reductase n=1 Tax=Solimonas sp. K1W22B-7 TaxID=2303331 RepID=UPI000E3328C6|nr:short-chain dehydrogenase/reductase [Solimonas sp. K1W22B-7]AXQ31148.1 SDR family NAD(P)-dependent oxidoreductase [Solimonas sp. K1W22B-7]